MKPTVPFITLVSILSGHLSVAQTNQPVEDWKAAASDVPDRIIRRFEQDLLKRISLRSSNRSWP